MPSPRGALASHHQTVSPREDASPHACTVLRTALREPSPRRGGALGHDTAQRKDAVHRCAEHVDDAQVCGRATPTTAPVVATIAKQGANRGAQPARTYSEKEGPVSSGPRGMTNAPLCEGHQPRASLKPRQWATADRGGREVLSGRRRALVPRSRDARRSTETTTHDEGSAPQERQTKTIAQGQQRNVQPKLPRMRLDGSPVV